MELYKIFVDIDMLLAKVIIIWLCSTLAFSANNFKKIVVEDNDALCLDGTHGAYYAYKGALSNKFLISFESGGWCGSAIGLN
jgi:hypothetical protein